MKMHQIVLACGILLSLASANATSAEPRRSSFGFFAGECALVKISNVAAHPYCFTGNNWVAAGPTLVLLTKPELAPLTVLPQPAK